ncbi:hypothetical protein ACX6XY_12190 [Streptomyces sp. O3]
MTVADPTAWDDLFSRTIDGLSADFVRPADTDAAAWGIYDSGRFLGMVVMQV